MRVSPTPGRWRPSRRQTLVETACCGRSGSLVVKIDIEGGEYDLLPPLAAALPRGRTRALIVAFHPGLLRDAGRSDAAVRDATRLCFARWTGWNATLLDIEGSGPDGRRRAHQLYGAVHTVVVIRAHRPALLAGKRYNRSVPGRAARGYAPAGAIAMARPRLGTYIRQATWKIDRAKSLMAGYD